MKRKIFIFLIVFFTMILSINKINAAIATSSTKIDDSKIRWFNCMVVDYDTIAYNFGSRRITWSDFYGFPMQWRFNVDEDKFLFGKGGGPIEIYGGKQNNLTGVGSDGASTGKERVGLGATQGIVAQKLVNNNLAFNSSRINGINLPLFPTESQKASADSTTSSYGFGSAYNKIYRDYKFPFVKEGNGYLSLDSSKQTVALDSSTKKYNAYTGTHLGKTGLYLFNGLNDNLVVNASPTVYTFGMRVDIPFYMTQNGMIVKDDGTQEDMKFSFRGDDDVWVYVDDELKLDIGGAHYAISGDINFAKNTSYVAEVWDSNNDVSSGAKVTNNLFGSSLLSEGRHVLSLFYLERFEGDSNFYARFNLQDYITVKHIDKDTGEELDEDVFYGAVDNKIITSAKDFDGYKLYASPSTEEYLLGNGVQTVTYSYAKAITVTTEYIDITNDNKKICEDSIEKVYQGDNYSTIKKTFPNYEFVEVSGNESGVAGNENIVVTYKYKKKSIINVEYVDKYSKEVLKSTSRSGYVGEKYIVNNEQIEGYFAETNEQSITTEFENDEKTITLYYIKKSNVIVRYLDEETGKDIPGIDSVITTYKEKDNYTTNQKNIEGYTFTRHSGNINGVVGRKDIEVIYMYSTIKGKITITKVDISNESIKLAGATYRIEKLNESGNIDKAFTAIEKVTGENGVAEFANLELGKYKITEVKAPIGYELLKDELEAEITKDQTDIQIVAKDKLKLVLPDTGAINYSTIISFVGLFVISLILVYKLKNKKI